MKDQNRLGKMLKWRKQAETCKTLKLDFGFSVYSCTYTHGVQRTHYHFAKKCLGCKLPCSCCFFKKKHSLFQALGKKRGAARVHSHGALNNCHKVQSGNGSSEIRAGGKSRAERLRLGPFLSWFQRGYPSVQHENTLILCWVIRRKIENSIEVYRNEERTLGGLFGVHFFKCRVKHSCFEKNGRKMFNLLLIWQIRSDVMHLTLVIYNSCTLKGKVAHADHNLDPGINKRNYK